MKIAGSGARTGLIGQRQGTADPEPEPHQNVTVKTYVPVPIYVFSGIPCNSGAVGRGS
jgi:hypothetical protein